MAAGLDARLDRRAEQSSSRLEELQIHLATSDVYRTDKDGGSLPEGCVPLVDGLPLMRRKPDSNESIVGDNNPPDCDCNYKLHTIILKKAGFYR